MSTNPRHPGDPDLNTRLMIERMQRAGRSEHQIVTAVRELLGETENPGGGRHRLQLFGHRARRQRS